MVNINGGRIILINKEVWEDFIKEKEKGITILSWFYVITIFVMYSSVFLYIKFSKNTEIVSFQALIILVLTVIGGNYSKQFYFNLTSYIIYYDQSLETLKMKKDKAKVETIINYLTLFLLQVYITQVVENTYFKIISISILFFISVSILIARFFIISSYDEELKKK